MTSPTLPYRVSVGFPTSRWSFPGYFLIQCFTTYLEQPYDLLPGRPIAQAVSVPHSPCVLIANRNRMESTPKYCEVFTQPQRQAYRAQHFWLEPPNFDYLGSDQFMPFALFTTLRETCPFESRQPLVISVY